MTQLMDKQRPSSDVVRPSSTASTMAFEDNRPSQGSHVQLRGINSAQQAYTHD